MPLKDELQQIRIEVLDDNETLTKYSKDASIFEIRPLAVTYPKNSEEIKSLVKFVTQSRLNQDQNLSLTVRSAGTDMSGGAINDGIILDVNKYINQLLNVNSDSAIVQPGMFYKDFEIETLKQNLILPCFTASKDLCTVGGMAANNSAGERTLTFGQTSDWVKKLKVILADGEEYLLEPQSKEQLDTKIAQNNFEGQIYKQIWQLISENLETIKKAKPKTHKNTAGYYLWNVYDGNTFDLTKLFVGSQGTLGIISEIEFKLITPNPHTSLLVINLNSHENLDKIINEVLRFKPQAFECYDDKTLEYGLKFLPELQKHFRFNNPLEVYQQFSEERHQVLPKLTLLAQFAGNSEAEVYQKAALAEKSLVNLNVKTKLIRTDKEAEKYWVVRHESFNMLRHHSTDMRSAPFIDDIIVRPQFLPEFLPKLEVVLEKYKDYMIYTIAGHIGDGNFHIIPLVDLKKEETKAKIIELLEEVNSLVLQFSGSLTAEHNDGLVRSPYLQKMYGEDVFQLFRKVKEIFDPQNIFNPHKKTDASFKYSWEHLIKG